MRLKYTRYKKMGGGGGGVNGHLLNITGLSNVTYATSNKLIHE